VKPRPIRHPCERQHRKRACEVQFWLFPGGPMSNATHLAVETFPHVRGSVRVVL
jgi:hypothetical protein